jgi:hypothetical protein
MTDNQNPETIAIIRKTITVSITFVDKPSDERRRQLKEAGYKYENGNWYRSDTEGHRASDALVSQVLAA